MACFDSVNEHECHKKKLHKYCRVCAKVLEQKETSHVCSDSGDMLKAFEIDVTQDDDCIQPKYYCHTCHTIGKRVKIGEKAGVECAIEVFKWTAHEDGNCWVCRGKAGRPKKSTKKRGRPKQESCKGIANAVLKNAPKSLKALQPLSLARFYQPGPNISLHDLQCTLCDCIVDRPVETPCRQLVCADCISGLVRDADLSTMQCPCCHGCHSITSSCFAPAAEVVTKVLGALLVRCDNPLCSAVIELKHLAEHVKSGCKDYTATLSPSKLTVQQILSPPLISPPTAVEQKAAANVVKRLIHTAGAPSSSPVVKLTTDGTVSNLHECLQNAHMHIQIHIYMYVDVRKHIRVVAMYLT